jgi:hypothetical protein
MTIRLQGSTSGYTEIDAPAVAGSNTLVTNGSGALSFADRGRMVLSTAQNSTSGTSIDFTGIPSWVKRITVMFSEVSTNGTSDYLVQLGDSGGIETTGYVSTGNSLNQANQSSGSNSTAGFVISGGQSTFLLSGIMTIAALGSNSWVSNHTIKIVTTNVQIGAGSKALSATLDRIRITTVNGTDTFDAGTINLLLEG